jgi:CheY-like chemotaxis protein
MSSASRKSGRERGLLVDIRATPSEQTMGETRQAPRGQRPGRSAPRRAKLLCPAWPAPANSAPEVSAHHGGTDGALALIEQPEARPAPRPAAAKQHILIVEDDPRVARVIREGLELEDEPAWAVQVASEGLHALELAGSTPPDVVLLDVHLPTLDGAEVYHQLRANPKTRRARVLFLTADTSLQLYQRGIEDGVLLRKPFDVQQVIGLVRALLEG